MNRVPTEITVYWDTKDPTNEDWAYEASDDDGLIDSGAIEEIEPDDLNGAIDDACSQLDVDLTLDDFTTEPDADGGSAFWSAS